MSELLQNLSNSLAEAVQTAGQSVVRVEGRRRMAASGIVWSADGVIVTARHVVRSRHRDVFTVGLPDGSTHEAKLTGYDTSTDLAVLKADVSGLSPANWSEDLQVGHLVLALGRPGNSVQATLGIVSALGPEWHTPMGGQVERYLQTDVLMYPGFSGGPLVSAAGAVLGLNTSALLRGVSMSLPPATVRRVVESVLAHGRVRRGYLGLSTQPVRLPKELRESTGQDTGLLVVGVEPDSPAFHSGLLLGDTITTFGDKAIRSHDDLIALLRGDYVGQKTPVTFIRGGETMTLNVTIGERE